MTRRALLAAYALLAACDPEKPRHATVDRQQIASAVAAEPPPGHLVDSALPIAEHLRRFRAGVDSTDRLQGGSPTPQALAKRFLEAVARRDTIDLARMVLTRPEFAWLYYPSHIYHDPPYELDPGTFWMLIQNNSRKGFVRVLRHYGGQRLEYRELRCTRSANLNPPLEESERCALEFTANKQPESRRMFGSIAGYGGRYKLVSHANEF
ncbi:MAG: hypothetical protein ACREOF_19225 [Gemmatimonadales bacterium]